MLKATRAGVNQRGGDGFVQGLKGQALRHLDEAINFTGRAIRIARWKLYQVAILRVTGVEPVALFYALICIVMPEKGHNNAGFVCYNMFINNW